LTLKGCARHWHQAVDRHALWRRIEIGQYLQHLQPIKLGFSHSDNSAAADREIRLLNSSYRIEPIRVTVRRYNFRIILLRSIDVMVVGGDACFFELPSLTQAQLPERDTNLHTELTHPSHNLEHLLKFRI